VAVLVVVCARAEGAQDVRDTTGYTQDAIVEELELVSADWNRQVVGAGDTCKNCITSFRQNDGCAKYVATLSDSSQTAKIAMMSAFTNGCVACKTQVKADCEKNPPSMSDRFEKPAAGNITTEIFPGHNITTKPIPPGLIGGCDECMSKFRANHGCAKLHRYTHNKTTANFVLMNGAIPNGCMVCKHEAAEKCGSLKAAAKAAAAKAAAAKAAAEDSWSWQKAQGAARAVKHMKKVTEIIEFSGTTEDFDQNHETYEIAFGIAIGAYDVASGAYYSGNSVRSELVNEDTLMEDLSDAVLLEADSTVKVSFIAETDGAATEVGGDDFKSAVEAAKKITQSEAAVPTSVNAHAATVSETKKEDSAAPGKPVWAALFSIAFAGLAMLK